MNKFFWGIFMLATMSLLITGCQKAKENPSDDTQPPDSQIEQEESNLPQDVDNKLPKQEEETPSSPEDVPEQDYGKDSVYYRYFLIQNDGMGIETPSAKMCTSPEDVASYAELLDTGYDLGDDTYRWSFSGFTRKYDDGFFKDNAVLFILLDEENSNVSHKVTSVRNKDNDLVVDILRENTDRPSESSAQWNVALELPKSAKDAENYIINIM